MIPVHWPSEREVTGEEREQKRRKWEMKKEKGTRPLDRLEDGKRQLLSVVPFFHIKPSLFSISFPSPHSLPLISYPSLPQVKEPNGGRFGTEAASLTRVTCERCLRAPKTKRRRRRKWKWKSRRAENWKRERRRNLFLLSTSINKIQYDDILITFPLFLPISKCDLRRVQDRWNYSQRRWHGKSSKPKVASFHSLRNALSQIRNSLNGKNSSSTSLFVSRYQVFRMITRWKVSFTDPTWHVPLRTISRSEKWGNTYQEYCGFINNVSSP